MEMVILVDRGSREKISELCERVTISFEWRDDGRNGIVKVEGSDEEFRFLLRRFETKEISFKIVSLDGKELLEGEIQG